MAFNKQTFKTRALTAIVFAALMLVGLLWNHWSFLVLFSIIHFGCWWEYLQLTEKIHKTSFHVYTKLGLMVMGFGLMLWFCGPVYHINNYSLKENLSLPVSAAGFALLLIGIFQKKAINLKGFGMAMLGWVYISLCWGMMIGLRREHFIAEININYVYPPDWHNKVTPCIIVFAIWLNDTMAYITGSLFGKTPLSNISPKKTWEGTIMGVLLSMIILGVVAYLINFDFKEVIIISAIASVVGTFGDLLESKLKRMAQVKDSGSIMPGHGGFLDRFDSLLLATPAVWIYLLIPIVEHTINSRF